MQTPQQGKPDSAVHRPYELTISRQTVDKLGVKLYDKASAVVAELVANSYDADAEKVTVRVPYNTLLAKKVKKTGASGKEAEHIEDLGYVIEVEDDGHGMTPDEAIDFYLRVGRDRRDDPKLPNGGYSRAKKRPVMGRKGIGKLAPFGICREIEVVSDWRAKDRQRLFGCTLHTQLRRNLYAIRKACAVEAGQTRRYLCTKTRHNDSAQAVCSQTCAG